MLFNISYVQSLCDKYGFVLNTNSYKVAPYIYVSSNIFSTAKEAIIRRQCCCVATWENPEEVNIRKFFPNFELEYYKGLRRYSINTHGIAVYSNESLLEAFKMTAENFAYAQSCWKKWYNEYKLSSMEKDFKC